MKKMKKLLTAAVVVSALVVLMGMATFAAGKVTGGRQTDAGESSVELKWNDYLGANNYAIYYSTSRNGQYVYKTWSDKPEGAMYSLGSGRTYFIKIRAYNGYKFEADEGKGTLAWSDPIEVVTAPSTSGLNTTQTGATTKSVTVTGTGAYGANYYTLTVDKTIIGASTSARVTSRPCLYSGKRYSLSYHPCRRSSTGFIAQGGSSYLSGKTVMGKLSKSSFANTTAYTNINVYYFDFATSADYDGYQWQFLKPNGKVDKTFTDNGRVSGYVAGKMLQYRVRTYVNCGTGRVYSQWSDCKTVGYVNKVKGKIYKNRTVKVSWKKVKNVSGYTIYTSTKEKSKYKKYKTVSAKKNSVVISKVAKKKLKKNKKYYVRIVPKAKVGKKTVTAGNYIVYSFYIY